MYSKIDITLPIVAAVRRIISSVSVTEISCVEVVDAASVVLAKDVEGSFSTKVVELEVGVDVGGVASKVERVAAVVMK